MKKIIIYAVAGLFLLVILLFVAPLLFKDKIINLIKQQANNNLNAVVNFDNNIGLTLFKSFPNITLGLSNLSIAGIDEFAGDTLLNIKKTEATLDLMSVINGEQIRILNIALFEPNINARVLKNGKANWDIAKTTDSTSTEEADTTATKFNIKLKKLAIENANLSYIDEQSDIHTLLKNLNYTLSGDFSQDIFTMQNILSIAGITLNMGGISYLNNAQIQVNADVEANMKEMMFTLKENIFNINALQLAWNGYVKMPDDNIETDITFQVKENSFKNFLSLIPAVYASDLNSLQTKGNLAFSGFVKGIYNDKTMPAFGLNVSIRDGWFKYTNMPAPMENVQLNLTISKPQGDIDLTEIDLKQLNFVLQQNPFSLLLKVATPVSDPFINLQAKGKIDFGQIKNLISLPEGTNLNGVITTDMFAKGHISNLEKKQYQLFNAGGTVNVKNFLYNSTDLQKPFIMPVADMSITPSVFNLYDLQATIGQTDFRLNGKIQNMLPYFFDKGLLEADFNLVSNQINANEFITEDNRKAAEAVEDTSSLTVFEVPENVNITFNSEIKKLIYTNLQITDFIGTITVQNRQVNFSRVAMQTLGSTIKMNGFYNTIDVSNPKVEFNFGIEKLDIQQAFKTFNTIQKLAPAAEKISGLFNMNFSMQTKLTQNMQPDLHSLAANGMLQIPKAEIQNLTTFSKLADALGKPEFKKGTINNTLIKFKVENGRVTTQPFDVTLGGKNITLSGSSGLDQTLDYIGKTAFNRNELGAANTALNSALAQLNNKLGSNISMNDVIPVNISITGTFTNPKIGTNLGEVVKGEAKNLTGQLADEAAKRKAELEAKARAEAERLKQEAEAKAQKAKAEAEAKARAEAERLKKEAEQKANEEKERLKKQAEEEARKKLRKIF